MKSKRKAALLVITEHIEMELFSSEEPCVVTATQEKQQEDCSFQQRHLEHPLVPQPVDEPEPVVQTPSRLQPKAKTEAHAEEESKPYSPVPEFIEDVHIEMQPGSNKLKWKKPTPHKPGLVVKDVVCLCSGQLEDSHEAKIPTIPRSKERAALAAMGLTARITIDSSWSAGHLQSRLAMLFRDRVIKRPGQSFSFVYLQCVQGSRVLFIPDTPTEGWTGEQVLRISGHGAVFVLSQEDEPQAEFEPSGARTPAANSFFTASESPNKQKKKFSDVLRTLFCFFVQFPLDLDTILRRFRQENVGQDAEIYVHVRRRDLLPGALRAIRRPDFCFRMKPIVFFSDEDAESCEGSVFFRSMLLELQQTSIFEGHPGRLLFTCDLTALEERKYYEAGVLIGWSLVQGGARPRCLHPVLYQLMCGQNPSVEDFSCSDIIDAEAQMRLQQLQSCSDVKLLSLSLCDWASSCGISGISSADLNEIPDIYINLVTHYIHHRVASMISQFKEGLNSCGGLWDIIQCHWEAFAPVMTRAQPRPLTLDESRQLFTVCYSRADSQLRAAEETTAGHWDATLSLITDGQADFSFRDLLIFITGDDHLPPHELISLRFFSQDESSSPGRLPYTSPCNLELFLPRVTSGPAELLTLLGRAVHEALDCTRTKLQSSS
ncbi:uncharacterized protein V6R79_012667 [Siganus canaliculatus]